MSDFSIEGLTKALRTRTNFEQFLDVMRNNPDILKSTKQPSGFNPLTSDMGKVIGAEVKIPSTEETLRSGVLQNNYPMSEEQNRKILMAEAEQGRPVQQAVALQELAQLNKPQPLVKEQELKGSVPDTDLDNLVSIWENDPVRGSMAFKGISSTYDRTRLNNKMIQKGNFMPYDMTTKDYFGGLAEAATSLNTINQMRSLGGDVWGRDVESSGNILGWTKDRIEAVKDWFSGKTKANADVATYMAMKKATLSQIVRSLGEKGTLAEGDVARAEAALPDVGTVGDTYEIAMKKFDNLAQILSNGLKAKQKIMEQQILVNFKPYKGDYFDKMNELMGLSKYMKPIVSESPKSPATTKGEIKSGLSKQGFADFIKKK